MTIQGFSGLLRFARQIKRRHIANGGSPLEFAGRGDEGGTFNVVFQSFGLHLVLQFHQGIDYHFGSWRTSGNIDIDRDEHYQSQTGPNTRQGL